MRIEIKATLAALTASAFMLAATFSLAQVLQSTNGAASRHGSETKTNVTQVALVSSKEAQSGYSLFQQNCAHCHGDDARGDEGPSLHNLRLSDAGIAKRIKEGIKGEMPSFNKKFNDADIQALIAHLRTLKD